MLCPKCKQEIPDNSLKCEFCNTKLASVCSECGTINPITAINCSNCNKELLKICPNCKAANLPNSKSCRKCKTEFKTTQKQLSSIIETNIESYSQQKAKSLLLESIKDGEHSIITLIGESGIGKNLVLRCAISELKSAKLLWLTGNCTQLTQLSPFGYFQDLLLTFFNINNFCPDTLQLKKNSIKFFKQDFPTLSNSEILDLLNLLYPENSDIYENIYFNKSKIFNIMKKILLTIVEKVKTIFIIDNFENIDGMSFDFFKEILEDDFFLERCKFIILTSLNKPGIGLITSSKIKSENYINIALNSFNKNQIEILFAQHQEMSVDKKIIDYALNISEGNPAVIEQLIFYYKDLKENNLKFIKYNKLEELLEARLTLLKQNNIKSYKMLIAMSLLGAKFYPSMLEHFNSNTTKDFENSIEYLVNKGYINQISTLAFEFKSNKIWQTLVTILKNDEMFQDILEHLYEILTMYKQSSIALIGFLVQKLNKEQLSFEYWTNLMKQSCYIGDIGLYIISQKQALKIIENKTSPQYQKIKKNIYTRVGKLIEPINSELSFEYLQKAIMMLEDNEEAENIELLGYLASSCMKKGNYWGVIECSDSVLNKLPEDMELERVLVKSRQIRPLLKLGNYGQLINLIDTEIMPILEKHLSKGKNTPIIKINELYDIWLETYFDLAEALSLQGDCRMFDIIQLIFEIIEKNKISDPEILCKAHLLLSLANSIKGDIKTSEKILDDILKEYSLDTMDSFTISRWNFIDIINKFQKKDYSSLYNELFNVVAFANNSNDTFTKNILKTLLAKMFNDKNETKKALKILEEQVSYFAKEKISTGVLLSWYLIAKIKLVTKGTQFALDIVTKALDIAQNPNINNYYFITLFNKLLSEIYMAKQDFDSAKVYIEKSIFIAKQFKLESILVKNYIQYAKLYQELALPKSIHRAEYIKNALKMFQLAKNVSITDNHQHIQKYIKSELNILTSFCKLNGIVLKKSSK